MIGGIAAGVSVVAVLVFFGATPLQEQPNNVQLIHGAGLQNADKCTKGDFVADRSKEVVEIVMSTYQWRYEYCSITVYEGQTVVITMQSLDVPHGFAIDGYPEVGSMYVSPNAQSVVKFTVDKTGIFTYYCTVFCGEGHPLHKGQLVVQSA